MKLANNLTPGQTDRPARSRYHVPNLERALAIMEFLGKHPAGLTATELVQGMKLPKNCVFRITMTLLDTGFLLRDEETRRFALSRKLLALGYTAVGEQSLIERSLDVMRDLRDQISETVILGTLMGTEAIALEQVPGLHLFRFAVEPGTRMRLHTSAPGKVIMAFMPEAEREALIGKIKFVRYNNRTLAKKDQFRRALTQIHTAGYAVDWSEELEGVHCIGAPIFNQHGYPIASIWTTGPANRLPKKMFGSIGQLIKEHALKISRRLGYQAA